MFRILFTTVISLFFTTLIYAQQTQLFNSNWEFKKDIDSLVSVDLFQKNSKLPWAKVSLPHTAVVEPLEKVAEQWQGICFYRKFFVVPASNKGKHIAIKFDAAMQEATVYLNGKLIFNHKGGYLPFYIDISKTVNFGVENCIIVKLNNQDNPLIPPGKPVKDLDFNYYSGIYRNVYLITKDKLYISNAIAANRTAGGGIMLRYENVNEKFADLIIKTEIQNDFEIQKNTRIKFTLTDKNGKVVSQKVSKNQLINKSSFSVFSQKIKIPNPMLWSPDLPYLYQLSIEVLNGEKMTDHETIKTGIKTINFRAGGFYLNGNKLQIRGTNRHQEYPYIGNALSDNAQYRDAYKIKLAGFNFVRSSHYPQSPAFLDACDELGIMVMDAIPGWQFVGNEEFMLRSYQDTRDMIRRDRNHPSIILWEASLNESRMSKSYMQKAHQIVHEELPFPNIYSAGWVDDVYDVFLPARQHGKFPDYWKNYKKDKPFLIAEYGDWEYYAGNAGFNQKDYGELKKEERSSRQLRGFGESRLLQQAFNFQESHNDNFNSPAVGDANWLMFDYKRGYAADIESSGIMDIVRLPKFSFYFYQSQVNPQINNQTAFNKPVLFIANYWQNPKDSTIIIYSNCEEVALFINGKLLGKQKPDQNRISGNLKHPPFTFKILNYNAGDLSAMGFINNKNVIQQKQKTAKKPFKINLRVDLSGREIIANQNDAVFIYADIMDENGTIVSDANDSIEFEVKGDAEIIGMTSVLAEAGVATILLKAGDKPGLITISAKSNNLNSAKLAIKSN